MAAKKSITKTKNGKTISVYEALSLRKLCENKLDDLITFGDDHTIPYVSSYSGNKTDVLSEKENKMKSKYDRLVALLRNIDELTSKINESNATTTVTIDGQTYTKAEAIYRYQNITNRIMLYERIEREITSVLEKIADTNAKICSSNAIDDRVNEMVSIITSSGEYSAGRKTIDEIRQECKDSIIENETMVLLDPYKLVDKVPEELDRLKEFKNRFNLEMNKSNLITEITVVLED